jgi:hypothetical protein
MNPMMAACNYYYYFTFAFGKGILSCAAKGDS